LGPATNASALIDVLITCLLLTTENTVIGNFSKITRREDQREYTVARQNHRRSRVKREPLASENQK
jgi:hypothetical protein